MEMLPRFLKTSNFSMVLEPVPCPSCNTTNVVKNSKSDEGKQRYRCRNPKCRRSSFIQNYSYRGYLPEVKQQISDMVMNGSGIRADARVLKISPTTVIEELQIIRIETPCVDSQRSPTRRVELPRIQQCLA